MAKGVMFGLAIALLAGCHGNRPLINLPADSGVPQDTKTDAADPDAATGEQIVLRDENNYRVNVTFSIPRVLTTGGDITVCWNEVAADFQCHANDPKADIDVVALARLRLSADEMEQKLAAGSEITQADVNGFIEHRPVDRAATCARLSAFTFLGTPIDVDDFYREEGAPTYLLMFSKGFTPAANVRSMSFLRPNAFSSNTVASGTSGCGLMQFSADLAGATPVRVPVNGPWVMNWVPVTRDGRGAPLRPGPHERVDRVVLAFFEGRTVGELQARPFDVESTATNLWEIENIGNARAADLSKAIERRLKTPFTGFGQRAQGVWLFALTCRQCQSTAPLLVSVLQPIGS